MCICVCKRVCIHLCMNIFTFFYKSLQSTCERYIFYRSEQMLTSEDRPLVRTRACGTALTGVYVHHMGTRVSILHTHTDTIGGQGTYCNLVRGAKMPSGSAVRSLRVRSRCLHTQAAGGEHKCLLLPVPACLRVLAGACLSIPIHPSSRTHTPSIANHK